ncbi:NUDIX hydrolase [Catalinimonas niigatensis]|uniref:NUDIX hydrolase n=1 Tax=Catalinimonas niigatensis TaxID=1397264 RepID=UPI0026658A99|nr:NUDIX domain-containing protein [Catalinimonas niigatensis]WPP50685.1 NUDIX domain-containing protein [Catalinimonas niigatensis]
MVLNTDQLIPGLSLDCVIFGFHENQLKVLLLRMKGIEQWALPGGFVKKTEDVDHAAARELKTRTGLDHIFLQQFHLFGDVRRNEDAYYRSMEAIQVIDRSMAVWLNQRFITVGYYALVDYSKVRPQTDEISDACAWFAWEEIPDLIIDHALIIAKALETLRRQLNYQPIGKNLLAEKFTMPELQALYETLLDQKLDRRNFQRKIRSYGILKRLEERRKGGAHKAPYLYVFDEQNYNKALIDGLNTGW